MALSINSGNYVNMGPLPISGYPFVMTGWFRVPDINVALSLMVFTNSTPFAIYYVSYAGGSTKKVKSLVITSSTSVAESAVSMSTGVWHQVTVLFMADDYQKVYLDGGNIGISSSSSPFNGADRFIFGNSFSSDFVDVADAAVINGTIDEGQIEQLALGAPVLSLPCARNVVAYHNCIERINHPALGPIASAAQTIDVVDHPRTIFPSIGHSTSMPFRTRGPFNLHRGECQSLFSEQSECASAGVESDNTIHYGEVLS